MQLDGFSIFFHSAVKPGLLAPGHVNILRAKYCVKKYCGKNHASNEMLFVCGFVKKEAVFTSLVLNL